jgi:hypothetical protein
MHDTTRDKDDFLHLAVASAYVSIRQHKSADTLREALQMHDTTRDKDDLLHLAVASAY